MDSAQYTVKVSESALGPIVKWYDWSGCWRINGEVGGSVRT